MEPISSASKSPQPLLPDQAPKPPPFKIFLKGFSKKEQEAFMRNMTQHFSRMIHRQMCKSREALRKLREQNK